MKALNHNIRRLQLILSLYLMMIGSFGCEKILEVKFPEPKPMITLNCILTSGDSIFMEIKSSQPYPPYSDSIISINNASVQLYEDQRFIGNLVYKKPREKVLFTSKYQYFNYYYPGQLTPQSGHSYSIHVSAPGFTDISSKTIIPDPVLIISVDTSTVLVNYGNSQLKALECLISFRDPEGMNRYMLTVDRPGLYTRSWYENHEYQSITSTIQYIVPFFCHDPEAVFFRLSPGTPGTLPLENDDESIWASQVYLADDSFKNKTYSLRIAIPFMMLNDNSYPPNSGEKYILRKLKFKLYTINDEYYRYAKSWYAQVYKKNDMFSEPVEVLNNIENGMGIFSGRSVSIDSSVIVRVYYNPSIY